MSSNTAYYFGGGIYDQGTLTLTNSTVSDNYVYYGYGGGIYSSGTLVLTDSLVTGNAGFYAYGGVATLGTATLTNTTVSANSSGSRGGGVSNLDGTLAIDASTVTGNYAEVGGGIWNTGMLTLTNSAVSDNTGWNEAGGLYNYSGEAEVTDTTVSGNVSEVGGGGILNRRATLTLTNSTVSGNSVLSSFSVVSSLDGGGIESVHATLILDSTTVSGNYARGDGGGISIRTWGYIYSSTLVLTNSTVSGNSAALSGGGINVEREHTDSMVTLSSSTVTDNSAGAGGSGIHNVIGPGEVHSTNSIVAANVGDNCSGPFVSNGHNLSDDTTCFSASGTDLVAAALLAPLADNGGPTSTHLPLSGSPAIDAGDDAACPPLDQRGAFRPQDGNEPPDGSANCDIGAVELLPEPGALSQLLAGLALLWGLDRRRQRA